MDMKKIAMTYTSKEYNEALHTKEVLENEMMANHLPFSKKRNYFTLNETSIHLIDIDKEIGFQNSKVQYDEIFATGKSLKQNREMIEKKTMKLNVIPYPTQAIADIMLLVLNNEKQVHIA